MSSLVYLRRILSRMLASSRWVKAVLSEQVWGARKKGRAWEEVFNRCGEHERRGGPGKRCLIGKSVGSGSSDEGTRYHAWRKRRRDLLNVSDSETQTDNFDRDLTTINYQIENQINALDWNSSSQNQQVENYTMSTNPVKALTWFHVPLPHTIPPPQNKQYLFNWINLPPSAHTSLHRDKPNCRPS